MSLKRTGPDSVKGGSPDSVSGGGGESVSDVARDTSLWKPPVTFDDDVQVSRARYESEAETAATPAAKKPKKEGAAKRFPGVFAAPADDMVGAPPEAPADPLLGAMETFSTDAETHIPSVRGGFQEKRSANVGNWAIHSITELVRFRDEITRLLPTLELSKLDLEQEVLLQYHTMRELQADVLADADIPANQRASVANSVASILKTLADRQESLYTSERFKDIENLLIRTLTSLPENVAAKFIDEYEKIVRKEA